ncbi:MAG: SRPBCC family protein [Actinomycetes bacterium]
MTDFRTRSVTRDIDADPGRVFALITDPRVHPLLDGSGTVHRQLAGPSRLGAGSRFTMAMRMRVLGVALAYRTTNEVVEFDEGRRIAWRHAGHHVWRYEVAPNDRGGSQVTETFAYAQARAPRMLERMGIPERNEAAMRASLDRLAEIAERRTPTSG